MNAYQEVQSSGILWPNRTLAPLYRSFQEVTCRSEPRHNTVLFADLEKQMVDPTIQQEGVLNEVRRYYVLPADSSVSTFLTEHRVMPEILLGASQPLRACFGSETVFNLRAPIDESGSRTLYVVAMWPGKLQDVRRALAKFDADWWMPRARQAAGYLTFTYELV